MATSMTFNILVKKEDKMWIAHCLELDIVTTSKTLPTLKKEIIDLIITQIDYAFSNDNLENLYHPAPPEVWAEFYTCKESIEKKIKMTPNHISAKITPSPCKAALARKARKRASGKNRLQGNSPPNKTGI